MRAGIENADRFVDARTLTTEEAIRDAAGKYTVFGRVTPAQKRSLVQALKADGHTVAMTGDGVNDVLALKEADCSIAMASGSDVACQVSHIVLLDSNFASMPSVVAEGRRSDKHYPLTSPEVCVEMGSYLLDRFENVKVDVHDPDVYIWVEIRDKAYVYSKVYTGACGMPLGTNGRAMLLLSGGIDSPVAGYMIAKRGVYVDAVYFHAPPYTSERALQKVVDLAKIISKYVGPIRLHVVNFTDIQLYIYEKCPHEELTIIMRRYMMRIAEKLAYDNDCLGLITGESIGQVASQTMHSLAATNEVCTLPVYRPLIGFDKQEIVDISEKIGTYETSIQPFEDCCTIFVAKHPVTKPDCKVIRRSEENLTEKIDEMVQTALDTIQIIEIDE